MNKKKILKNCVKMNEYSKDQFMGYIDLAEIEIKKRVKRVVVLVLVFAESLYCLVKLKN